MGTENTSIAANDRKGREFSFWLAANGGAEARSVQTIVCFSQRSPGAVFVSPVRVP